jgi:acetyl-CoA carboxylase biotin carboxyl carrier protein
MTIEEIREMIQMVTSTGVAELEVQRGDNRVWIKRTAGVVTQEIHMPQQAVSQAPMPIHPPPPHVTVSAPATAQAGAEPDLTDPALEAVKSPIVGTFYESSAPGADMFVRVGDSIKPGTVLCIIESMKLMNEIESEISGTIVKRLVQNGAPVEYGEVLFLVKPN